MLKRLSLLLAGLGMLLPLTASALGLGEIRLSSALNEPLRAEIPLVSVTAEETDLLSVRLAPRDHYQRAGIVEVPELRQLRFEAVTGADGKPVIKVTTREPVSEPFLNFLIEVNWPAGRVVREFTLLLDPPVMMRGAPPISQTPQASLPAAERPPSVSAPSAAVVAPPSGGRYGPVVRGETLWTIATEVRPDPGLTIPQVMLALQQANPDAFLRNNINLLRSGVVLRVPSREEMQQLAAADAKTRADQQEAEWESYRQQVAGQPSAAPRTEAVAGQPPAAPAREESRLELVVPKPPEGEAAQPSSAPEGVASAMSGEVGELRRQLDLAREEAEARRLQNDELNAQIRDLEEQVASLEKLLALNSDEMAALQENLRAKEAGDATAAQAPAPAEGQQAAAPSGEAQPPAEPAKPEGEPTAAAPTTEPAPTEAKPAEPAGEAAHGHAPGTPEKHQEEAAKPAPPPPPPPAPAPEPELFEDPWILGGLAAILLALVGVVVAKRRGAKAAEEEEETVAEVAPAVVETAVEAPAEAAAGGLMGRLKGLFSRKGKATEAEEEEEVPEVPFAATAAAAPAAAAAAAAEEAEPAPEEPAFEAPSFEAGEATGRDVLNEFAPAGLQEKKAAVGEDPLGQADVFLAYGRNDQAEELLRNALAQEPRRVDFMTKLLEIYAAGRDRANFEHQLEDLHEALGGEPGPHWDHALELARGIAPDHRLVNLAASEPEVSFEEPELGDDYDIDLDFEPLFGDEEDAADEPLDITQELGGEAAPEAPEEEGEAPLDLGFSIGDEDEAAEEPALGGGLDLEGTDELESTGELESTDELESTGELEATAELPSRTLDDLDDFDLDAEEEAPAAAADTGVDMPDDLDLDLGLLDDEEPAAEPEGGMDLPDLDLEETMAGGDFGDLGDFGGDMVGTKLELAQTYLDMEDHAGARAILDEVLAEGNDAQKQQARELLERCPDA